MTVQNSRKQYATSWRRARTSAFPGNFPSEVIRSPLGVPTTDFHIIFTNELTPMSRKINALRIPCMGQVPIVNSFDKKICFPTLLLRNVLTMISMRVKRGNALHKFAPLFGAPQNRLHLYQLRNALLNVLFDISTIFAQFVEKTASSIALFWVAALKIFIPI